MKHRVEYVHPEWPNVDEDEIYLRVLQAFRETYLVTDSTLITIYKLTFQNTEMTRWTALVDTVDESGVSYYEIYYNGHNPIFVM